MFTDLVKSSEIQRFHTHFVKRGKNNCWNWLSYKDKDGYGSIYLNSCNQRAHRAAYQIYKGRIPEGLLVCHRCDNPSCVNPNHLFLGTPKSNHEDMVSKGRLNPATGSRHSSVTKPHRVARGNRNGSRTTPESRPRGSSHLRSKLVEQEVVRMRELREEGALLSELATTFGVSLSVVCNIVRRKTWRHV